MTKFLDGPAVNVVLMLQRAPRLLRVVRASGGEWDALDQVDDTPSDDEAITVYAMVAGPWRLHIDRSRKAGGSAWFWGGEFRALPEQPADAIVRNNAAWRAWATANVSTALTSLAAQEA